MAGLALAVVALSGCTGAGPAMEQLPPQFGGLPPGAPPRPATPYQYPAVHDMPPPRATRPMTADEVQKAERDLEAVRDRQEARHGGGKTPASTKKTPAAAKKPPADTMNGQNTGAKTNP
jgi:hypothetical protein